VPVGVGNTCLVKVRVPADLPPGLHAIVLVAADGSLLDVQLNAAYRPADIHAAPTFVLASDMQWGDASAIADAALSFVSLMNALSAAGKAPDFIVMAGDIVDGQFGSANSVWSKLFGGAENYSRDFLQAWLVLAALRVPIYLVPGNHDGYRFQDAVGELRSDGLLMFQSTFGPLYYAVDRPPWRFVLLNSYDLPSDGRTIRRGEASNVVERFSDRLNVLNWGGGIRAAQHRWLRRQLGLGGGPPVDLSVALIMHHDPRGGYAALRREFQQRQHQWTTDRHLPITTDLMEAADRPFRRAPRFADTEEIHLGYYTPFRDARSLIRGSDWFDLGMQVALPDSLGWPGWSKYQQGWHAPAVYGRGFSDIRGLPSTDLVPPATILRTIVDGQVRAIFKGHDNRFAHAHMSAGDSILTGAAERGLLQTTTLERRTELQELHLRDALDVYHVADLADFNTDGHGLFWVKSRPSTFTVLPIDHW
jgi:3',5'-cyclic AMP phosphodiesterase CpdA